MSLIHKKGLSCLMMFFLTSCSGIKWKPDFYSIDKYNLTLVNSHGKKTPIKSDKSDKFSCLSEEKILELIEILNNSFYYGPNNYEPAKKPNLKKP
jgi:hypothetical protein